MSVVLESYTTFFEHNPSSKSSISMTKPTGLSVGDVLIAIISLYDTSLPSHSISLPTGWTQIISSQSSYSDVLICYKVADSSDVSVSTFTFSFTTTYLVVGFLGRLSGVNPLHYVGNSTGGTVQTGTTISYSQAGINLDYGNSFLMMFGVVGLGNDTSSFSSQTIDTSNPTWTELVDSLSYADNSNHIGLMVATATRTENTSTGNFSFTVTCSGSGAVKGFIIQFRPYAYVNCDAAVASATVATPTITGGGTVACDVAVASAVAKDVSFQKWKNKGKSSSSWTNQTKS